MQSFKGIIPPMITPLQDEGTLDIIGLEKLIEHLVGGGVHGLFILGTTGEGPSLNYRLRAELIQRVCKQVAGRVPVLIGITDSSFTESVNLAEKAALYGADALVVAPPYYFNINPGELYRYIDQLVNELPLPLLLYNFPALTKSTFPLDLLDEFMGRPEIVGFKDSSADLIYFHKVNNLANREKVSVLTGPEELLMESLIMGGDGGVSGGANIIPELYVDLYKAVKEGEREKAFSLHQNIMKLSSIVYRGKGNSSGNVINGIKCALCHLDICNDYMAYPLKGVTGKKSERIKKFMAECRVDLAHSE